MVHNPGGDWNPGWGVDLTYSHHFHPKKPNGEFGFAAFSLEVPCSSANEAPARTAGVVVNLPGGSAPQVRLR